MKILNILTAAAISAGAAAAFGAPASAETYVVSETRSNVIACYNRVYVPAKVQVNTKGVKVQGESTAWRITGDRWERVRNPSVYIQTRKTLEEDHYTLVRC